MRRGSRKTVPSNFIFSPISVNACTKLAVSLLDTCPPSLLSMFNPSVQSAHLLSSGAIISDRLPSCALSNEKLRGLGTFDIGAAGRSEESRRTLGGGKLVPVTISLIIETSMRSGRSSNPFRTGNLTALSTKWRYLCVLSCCESAS
jgi:hypothetical protein